VLVTNDDGIGAPGIDALVEALRKRPLVAVTVVAPATNESGSGDAVSHRRVLAVGGKTASGFGGWAVQGTPADAVNYALKYLAPKPQLVISGLNDGQNLGPFVNSSGTIGAARTALRAGIPALASSQGLGSPPDYRAGVAETMAWFNANRTRLGTTSLPSINTPTCSAGSVRGIVTQPQATRWGNHKPDAEVDCSTPAPSGSTDIDAYFVGYATLNALGY
jgi:5'-nucleotidase